MNLDAYRSYERRKDGKLVENIGAKDVTNMGTSQPNLEKGIGSDKDFLRRTGTRVSLTCRHVPKVYKNLLRL